MVSQSVIRESFHSPVPHQWSTWHLGSCLPFPLYRLITRYLPVFDLPVPVQDLRLLSLMPSSWSSPPGSVCSWTASLLLLGSLRQHTRIWVPPLCPFQAVRITKLKEQFLPGTKLLHRQISSVGLKHKDMSVTWSVSAPPMTNSGYV